MNQQDSVVMTAVADRGIRVVGYLIDVIPAILLGLLALIPIVGAMLAGVLLTPYWLLRDITGRSLGKIVLGLRVAGPSGRPVGTGARILRNVPLAVGPVFMIIPFLGYILGPIVTGIIVLIEAVFLLTQGERLGDRFAGTKVVTSKKRPAAAAVTGG